MRSHTFTPFRLGPVSQVFLWGSLLHNTSVFPFLSAKNPFTLHDFPTNLRNLGFQTHVMPQSSEGSRETSTSTVGDQLQWGPKPNKSLCFARPGLKTSGITIMDFLKDLGGNSWVAHTVSTHETPLPSGGCLNFIAWKCEPVSFKTQKILGPSPQNYPNPLAGFRVWAWRLSLHPTWLVLVDECVFPPLLVGNECGIPPHTVGHLPPNTPGTPPSPKQVISVAWQLEFALPKV